MAGLVDLDELALRCRDEQARQYIQEAVACYKAGAFRSCIVATWNAVVFDFLHKLRELNLLGDGEAKNVLDRFETIRLGGESKLKEALDFERDVLNIAATKFELLTPIEEVDLARLQSDRNRCAHPSMQTPEDPYRPTAELARTHLRNAVELMLEREPVQGKAAFDQLCSEIKSLYFPKDIDGARKHFEVGPLRRAKPALIRSLLLGISNSNLNDEQIQWDERRRQLAAIGAIIELHRQIAEEILKKELNRYFLRVPDHRQWAVVEYMSFIPLAWYASDQAVQGKAINYLESLRSKPGNERLFVMATAMNHATFKAIVTPLLETLNEEELSNLISWGVHREYVPHAIRLFAGARSFRGAEALAESLIIPHVSVITVGDIENILGAAAENGQIYAASKIPGILSRILDETRLTHQNTAHAWNAFIAKMKRIYGEEHFQYDGLRQKLLEYGIFQELSLDN